MAKKRFKSEEVADIVTNDDFHMSDLDSDGEPSSDDTSDTDWGSEDGTSSGEESPEEEGDARDLIELSNDIGESSTDTMINEINGNNSAISWENVEKDPDFSERQEVNVPEDNVDGNEEINDAEEDIGGDSDGLLMSNLLSSSQLSYPEDSDQEQQVLVNKGLQGVRGKERKLACTRERGRV